MSPLSAWRYNPDYRKGGRDPKQSTVLLSRDREQSFGRLRRLEVAQQNSTEEDAMQKKTSRTLHEVSAYA